MRLTKRMLQAIRRIKKKAAIQQTAQTAASEAHAELKKEIAAATSEEADMLSRLEMAERTVEENRKPHPAGKVEEVPEEEEEPVTIGSLAMPSYSAAQLASRVKKAGDAPDIVKDDITRLHCLITRISSVVMWTIWKNKISTYYIRRKWFRNEPFSSFFEKKSKKISKKRLAFEDHRIY